eukprot:CAMPEP_0206507710 /NCGR_PEP_ID=MMETSP0324_2-20121206/57730_1 /ASSEMBLY_ACC=CAM_ASM_000836 /TAXON_ID=2866 /ORGANISM="Crypthecodinium cohnii, Strain Seligo" /LENGTH=359 /DNA_ID=CAMNT_0053998097 /DNA_START=61 /DNA_END=1140 /DNA_ORIENTATION=-
MFRSAVGFALLLAARADLRSYESYSFEEFLAEHGKQYNTDYEMRKQIFEENLKKVIAHNEEYKNGVHSWYMAMNHLADYTEDEFAAMRSSKYNPSQHPIVDLARSEANPESIDWRTKGAVTKVKNQGMCGSCWAFAATESVESHYQIASGKLLELAPQTYVNCVQNPDSCGGTGGCQGATHELAFNLTVQSGIALESDLPYAGRNEKCSSYKAAVKATGYVKLPANEALPLETALATKGPVSVTVSAEPWQLYGGGVFTGCSKGLFASNTLDHGVQAVGYSKDYWIVRNSWGASWGESGFIRVSRASDGKTFTDKSPKDGVACKPYPKTQTVGGECGILFDTSFPTGVEAATDESLLVV